MEVRDPIYSFEIARRSVGRAAFHLGIDSMSEAALDVLADILLNYLNRVGRTLSHLVESSGRTSAHVNLLDALQACEVVAAPAVERLHLRDANDEEMFATPSATGTHLRSDWRGLADFLFGPKWLEEAKEDEEAPEKEVQGAGGKEGPSATDTAERTAKNIGWDAPYLDEVHHFPQASQACANPHSLPPHVGLSLHRADEGDDEEEAAKAEEEELDQIPDKVFAGSWGSILKRKADAADKSSASEDVTMTDAIAPPSKKVKLVDGTARGKKSADEDNNDEEGTKDESDGHVGKPNVQIPSFYPPLPPTKISSKETRTVVDVPPPPRIEKEEDGSRAVRSSLVQLGSYWGSGWDTPSSSKVAKVLAVPLGRSDTGEQPAPSSSAIVVPLGRASGSRVSRILEGSMDAAAMQ